MAIPADIETAIDSNARNPKKVKLENEEVEQHSIADQIAADQYLAGKTATGDRKGGINLRKLKPGNSLGY